MTTLIKIVEAADSLDQKYGPAGRKYVLKVFDDNGNERPKSDWVHVTWNGTSLVDKDGCTWTEWLDTPEDVLEWFPKENK